MASIIDSYREVFTDRLSFLKLLVFAVPAYFSYQIYMTSKGDFTFFFWVAGVTLFFLFGFLTKTTNNVIKGGQSILPSVNPVSLALTAVKAVIAVAPASLLFGALANYACSFIKITLETDIVIKTIIWFFSASGILTSYLMYVKDEKILDAFNFKFLFEKLGDVIVSLFIFVLVLALTNILLFGILGYVLNILFGYGFIFDCFVTYAVIFDCAVVGHYMAQMQYDNLGYGKPSVK